MNNPSEILTATARDIAGRIIDVLGEANVRCVFIAGSVAAGEVNSFDASGVVELLSDIDLYVVVAGSVDLGAARRSVRGVMSAYPRSTERYRMLGSPDVGVFDEADLLGQPVRPGTVGLVQQRIELFGQSIGEALEHRFGDGKVAPEEALYLLENRLLEIGDAWAVVQNGESERRYADYVVLKGCADVATAVLISRGEFVAARSRRVNAFLNDDAVNNLVPANGRELVRDCSDCLRDLQAVLADAGDEQRRRRVETLMIDVWLRIARRVFGSGDLAGLIETRAAGPGHAGNVRELLVLARRAELNRLRIALGAAPSSRFSPVALLRLSGLIQAVTDTSREAGEGRQDVHRALDRLTRLFGYDEGDLFDRAGQVRKAIG